MQLYLKRLCPTGVFWQSFAKFLRTPFQQNTSRQLLLGPIFKDSKVSAMRVLCVCFHFTLHNFPLEGVGRELESFECRTEQADFSDWVSFLASNHMEKKLKHCIGMEWLKDNTILGIKWLIIANWIAHFRHFHYVE